jgi:transposase-like protein
MLIEIVRYPRYRFPPAIISHAVWLYYRFALSYRDVQDLLAQRGITVSYESIRQWCETFGSAYARRLRRRAVPSQAAEAECACTPPPGHRRARKLSRRA